MTKDDPKKVKRCTHANCTDPVQPSYRFCRIHLEHIRHQMKTSGYLTPITDNPAREDDDY